MECYFLSVSDINPGYYRSTYLIQVHYSSWGPGRGQALSLSTAISTTGKERVMEHWQAFVWDEAGASAVEYALLISGIAAAIAVAIFLLGQAVNGLYTSFTLS